MMISLDILGDDSLWLWLVPEEGERKESGGSGSAMNAGTEEVSPRPT